MKVLEPIIAIKEDTMTIDEVVVPTNSISGHAIDGGKITNFSSTGIKDTSTDIQLTVTDDSVQIAKDIHTPTITSDTAHVKSLHADNVWIKGHVNSDRLVYKMAQADNFDVKKAVRINMREVLWEDRLGNSIKFSALQEVGVLNKLQVGSTLSVEGHRVGINTNTPQGYFAVDQQGDQIVLDFVNGKPHVGMHTNNSIDFGNGKTKITVAADGMVGIGVSAPSQKLEVDGNIKFAGKTITHGNTEPKSGNWQKGDICYNDDPTVGGYVGWVCMRGGAPGTWSQFGQIN